MAAQTPNNTGDATWVDKDGSSFPFSREDYNQFFLLEHPELDNDSLEALSELKYDDRPLEVKGALPKDLVGDYFLNGPSLFKLGGKLMHPFDGHGFMRRLTINGADESQAPVLRSDVMGTEAFNRESQARAIVYRGLGSLPNPPDSISGTFGNLRAPMNKNVANTCVVRWGGKILALWEGGPPHVVVDNDFRNAKPYTFGGAFEESSQFLAHTRLDTRTNRLVGLNMLQGPGTTYTFLEFDEDHALRGKVQFRSSRGSFVHDFLITEHYYVVVESPISLKVGGLAKFAVGLGPMIGGVGANPSTNCFVSFIPRDLSGKKLDPKAPPTDATDSTLQVDVGRPLTSFHHANAYEWTDGKQRCVTVYTTGFPDYNFGNEFGFSEGERDFVPSRQNSGRSQAQMLWQFDVTIDSGPNGDRALLKAARCLDSISCLDFVSVHPSLGGFEAQYIWGSGSTYASGFPFNLIVKLDTTTARRTTWQCHDRCFLGEALFVPRQETSGKEDCGYLLCCAYDAAEKMTKLLVLDAAQLPAGPIAEISFGRAFPFGFHGNWHGKQIEQASPRARL